MSTTAHTRRSAEIPRIAIVGGGPGGVLTAWHLERQATRPLDVTVFEASDRLGGKLLTPSFTTARVRYEAGAAELYDYTPVGEDSLRDLIAALGLPTVPLGGATVVTPDGPIANLDDLASVLGSTARWELEAFDRQARGAMTRREFYAADHTPADDGGTFAGMLAGIREPAARRYVETMIHSDLATEPGLTNVGYGLQNYLMNDPAYMRLYCIVGGNERLMEAIVAGLNADIRLETAVRRIDAAPGGGFTVATAGSPAGRRSSDSGWPTAARSHSRQLPRRQELAGRFREVVSLRRRAAMLAPAFHRPAPQPPTLAGQLGERLRDRTRLVERLEYAVEQADLVERVYGGCGERSAEFVAAPLLYGGQPGGQPLVIGGLLFAAAAGVMAARPLVPAQLVTTHLLWSMFPPTTPYVLGTMGGVVLLATLLHRSLDASSTSGGRFLRVAGAMSRHSLSLYILHHVAHLWPLWLVGFVTTGDATALWQVAMPVSTAICWAVACLCVMPWLDDRMDRPGSLSAESLLRWLCEP